MQPCFIPFKEILLHVKDAPKLLRLHILLKYVILFSAPYLTDSLISEVLLSPFCSRTYLVTVPLLLKLAAEQGPVLTRLIHVLSVSLPCGWILSPNSASFFFFFLSLDQFSASLRTSGCFLPMSRCCTIRRKGTAQLWSEKQCDRGCDTFKT